MRSDKYRITFSSSTGELKYRLIFDVSILTDSQALKDLLIIRKSGIFITFLKVDTLEKISAETDEMNNIDYFERRTAGAGCQHFQRLMSVANSKILLLESLNFKCL